MEGTRYFLHINWTGLFFTLRNAICANSVVVELSIGNCKSAKKNPLLYDTRFLENALSLGNPLIIMKYGTLGLVLSIRAFRSID